MPIKVVAVPKPEYEKWLGEAKKKFAAAAPGDSQRAADAKLVDATSGGATPAGN